MRQTITQRPVLTGFTSIPSLWQLRTLYEGDVGVAGPTQVLELGRRQSVGLGRREDWAEGDASWGEAGSESMVPTRCLGLDDGMVSRRHAFLRMTGDGPLLQDTGSKNGTLVNGERLPAGQERRLASGDIVQVGYSFLICRCEPPVFGDPGVDCAADQQSRALSGLLGVSLGVSRLRAELPSLARLRSRVLVLGESGTGKEEVAQALAALARIERLGPGGRSSRPLTGEPLVVIDCSALAHNLIESELFGHKRGAFTGATGDHVGAFERADGGTVFLDEIGELPLELQPKLLRVLEQREVRRVGDTVVRPVDVQVIAATNRDLEAACRLGRFREELLARLAGAVLRLPPLRERREDILLLARHFVGARLRLSPQLVASMLSYDWPLNIRELRNLMVDELPRGEEQVLRRLRVKRPISESHVVQPAPAPEPKPAPDTGRRPGHAPGEQPPSREVLDGLLRDCRGNLSQLERVTGYSRRHLRRLASDDYGLDLQSYREPVPAPAALGTGK
jgi:DNA-binding NtrC family response regulator